MYVTLRDSIGRKRFVVPVASFAQCEENGLILIELVGVAQANEAAWANIVKQRSERSVTDTNLTFTVGSLEKAVRVTPLKGRYKRAVKIQDRVLIKHEGLSRFNQDWLIGGSLERPSPWFFQAAANKLLFPILPHWSNTLWKAGINERLVIACNNQYGVSVWEFKHQDYYAKRWEKLVIELIKGKQLKEEPNG
jgi:hypothetical protein